MQAASCTSIYSCMHFQHFKEEEEEEEEEDFGRLASFWFGTFAMLFRTTGCVHHEDEWYACYKGL